jgi:hypothetical protein
VRLFWTIWNNIPQSRLIVSFIKRCEAILFDPKYSPLVEAKGYDPRASASLFLTDDANVPIRPKVHIFEKLSAL